MTPEYAWARRWLKKLVELQVILFQIATARRHEILGFSFAPAGAPG